MDRWSLPPTPQLPPATDFRMGTAAGCGRRVMPSSAIGGGGSVGCVLCVPGRAPHNNSARTQNTHTSRTTQHDGRRAPRRRLAAAKRRLPQQHRVAERRCGGPRGGRAPSGCTGGVARVSRVAWWWSVCRSPTRALQTPRWGAPAATLPRPHPTPRARPPRTGAAVHPACVFGGEKGRLHRPNQTVPVAAVEPTCC